VLSSGGKDKLLQRQKFAQTKNVTACPFPFVKFHAVSSLITPKGAIRLFFCVLHPLMISYLYIKVKPKGYLTTIVALTQSARPAM